MVNTRHHTTQLLIVTVFFVLAGARVSAQEIPDVPGRGDADVEQTQTGQPSMELTATEPKQPTPVRWVTRGAETRPPHHGALEIRAGFPSADIVAHFGIGSHIEINPYLSFDYLWPEQWAVFIGNTFGAQIKFQVLDRGSDAMSLAFDFGVFVVYSSDSVGGVKIGAAELKYSHRFDNVGLALIAGIKTEMLLPFHTQGFAFGIPILLLAGFEYRVRPNVTIHLIGEPGIAVGLFNRGFSVTGHLQFGVSYLW